MDGWAVLTALKADPDVADIPVVMLTVMHETEMGYLLGAAEYLTQADRPGPPCVIAGKYTPQASSPTVLVVEDDRPTREVLDRSLSKRDGRSSEAQNGRVALERTIAGPPPGLVLLDLMMPEMDGFEFLEEMRRRTRTGRRPGHRADEQGPDGRRKPRDLRGKVERIVQKGAYSSRALLREVQKIAGRN